MNKLILCIFSLILFLILYYNIIKVKEEFTNNVTEDEKNQLIKKHEVDYSKMLLDSNNFFTYKLPSNYKINYTTYTKPPISFWSPMTDLTIHSIGTAISENNQPPETLYTAVEGVELTNPIKFEKVYQHGPLKSHIQSQINNLNTNINNSNNQLKYYQYIVDLYNKDDKHHVVTLWSNKGKYYNVVNKTYWINNKAQSPLQNPGTEWWRFDNKSRGRFTHVEIPAHMKIDVEYHVHENGRWNARKKTIIGVDHYPITPKNTINIVNKNKQNEQIDISTIKEPLDIHTNVMGATTIKHGIKVDLRPILNIDIIQPIIITSYTNSAMLTNMNSKITELKSNISNFTTEINVRNNMLSNTLFSIWRPIPPEGYIVLGDILERETQPSLSSVKCIPKRCTKEMRNWDIKKDRKIVIQDTDTRISIYKNPFQQTMYTFVEKNINNKWEYEGESPENTKILRLYPCIPKCDYVDNLIEADKCAKNMCTNKKKLYDTGNPLNYKVADTEEENMLLDEIKEQDLLLESLQKQAEEMEMKQNKFNIIQKEFNRGKFNRYLKDQKLLHEDSINKLYNTKDGLAVNINSPGGVETLKTLLKDYLVHYANILANKSKNNNSNPDPGSRNLPATCTNWTEFKKDHRCKYNNPPCFGCVNPS